MSAFNAEIFLREAIDSVLKQSLEDFEFIIFDDKSTDHTLQILKEYRDARLVIRSNLENQGLTRNLVLGMEMARGKYVARMDADDICLPNRLQSQVDYLEQHPEISVLGSSVMFFDGHGHEIIGSQPECHEAIQCELLFGFTMLHPSVMMRRADLERRGLKYDPHFICSQDHDLWTRASRVLRFANLNQPLLKMREHRAKIGRTKRSKQMMLSDEIRRRQLDELGVIYTDAELAAFNAGAGGVFLQGTVEQLASYDRMVGKIIAANQAKNLFHQPTLERIGAAKLRGLCRMALLQHNPAGRYYWRSQLRALDDMSFRDRLGLMYRSVSL